MTRIYDPLGIAGPVVVAAKIFIQQLWEKEMSWDEQLPQAQSTSWLEFRTALNILNNKRIPRHIFDGQKALHRQIHIFVDASEKSYGAVVYLRFKL